MYAIHMYLGHAIFSLSAVVHPLSRIGNTGIVLKPAHKHGQTTHLPRESVLARVKVRAIWLGPARGYIPWERCTYDNRLDLVGPFAAKSCPIESCTQGSAIGVSATMVFTKTKYFVHVHTVRTRPSLHLGEGCGFRLSMDMLPVCHQSTNCVPHACMQTCY